MVLDSRVNRERSAPVKPGKRLRMRKTFERFSAVIILFSCVIRPEPENFYTYEMRASRYFVFDPGESFLRRGLYKSIFSVSAAGKDTIDLQSKNPAEGITVKEERLLMNGGSCPAAGQKNAAAVESAAQGKWAIAIRDWEELLIICPEDTAVLNNLGLAMSLEGKMDRALELFSRCLAAEKNEICANHYKATVNVSEKMPPVYKEAE